MTYDARLAVSAGLDHLADRLGPIIATRLAADLGGLPWTAVLSQLDEIAGRPPRVYSAGDLQAQLKMLTRRLGNLGFPFDDHRQTVSTLGRELTIVRNARAHGDDFTALDAWRALDYCVRLLEHFTDDGVDHAHALRHEAFEAYAAEQGVSSTGPTALPAPEPDAPRNTAEEPDQVEPPSEAFERGPASAGQAPVAVGDARLPFEPWVVVPAGDASVLDALPTKVAKNKVRAVALEIVDAEWPIHLDRVTSLVAASFGVRRLHEKRAKKIRYQVQQTGAHLDADKFVWPDAETAGSWAEFRPSSSSVDRPFSHVSPVEIANAFRFHLAHAPGADTDAVERAVLQTFGRKRRTKDVAAHLTRAAEPLAHRP